MCNYKFRHGISVKAITVVLVCLFFVNPSSYAGSYALALRAGNPAVYDAMQQIMESRLRAHQEVIDKFIEYHISDSRGLSQVASLEDEFLECIRASNAKSMLDRLYETLSASGGRLQVLFVEKEEDLPVFEEKRVWGHAGKYVTAFALKSEAETKRGRLAIISRLFWEIRSRSTKAKEIFDNNIQVKYPDKIDQAQAIAKSLRAQFEENNKQIALQIEEHAKITSPQLQKDFSELLFDPHPDVMNRSYTMSGKSWVPTSEGITDVATVQSKDLFIIQKLLNEEEDFFRQVVNFFNSPGASGTEIISVYGTTPFKANSFRLRAELREIINVANRIFGIVRPLIEAGDRAGVSRIAQHELYPLLNRLNVFLDETYKFVQDINNWDKDSGVKNIVARDLRKMKVRFLKSHDSEEGQKLIDDCYGELKTILAGYMYDKEEKVKKVDLNKAAYIVTHNMSSASLKPVFSKVGPESEIKPSDLQFILSKLADIMRQSILDTHEEVLKGLFKNNRFYVGIASSPKKFLTQTEEGRVYNHIISQKNSINLTVGHDEEIFLSYSAMPEIYTTLVKHLQINAGDFSVCQKMAQLYGGGLEIITDDKKNEVTLLLKMPSKTSGNTKSFNECKALIDADESRDWPLEPEMKLIELQREVRVGDKIKTYKVKAQLAALMSEAACLNLLKMLEVADRYMAKFGEVNVINMHALRTSGMIQETYNIGQQEIILCMDNNASGMVRGSPAYSYIFQPFSWEEKRPTITVPKEEVETDGEQPLDSYGIKFAAATFLDKDIEKLLIALREKADFVHMPIEHDQEGELADEEGHIQLVKDMLISLCEVLDAVQALYPNVRLRVTVESITAFRTAEVGSLAKIFSLNVSDSKGKMLAEGGYDKNKKKFIYKTVDSNEINTVIRKVLGILKELLDGKRLNFRNLDKRFEQEGITLPDDLIFNLISAANGEGGDMYFRPPEPADVLRNFLLKPDVQLIINGSKITVQMKEEEVNFKPSWGIITQMNGSSPEEVYNYKNAVQLFEEDYSWFQPNSKFLERYYEGKENDEGHGNEDTGEKGNIANAIKALHDLANSITATQFESIRGMSERTARLEIKMLDDMGLLIKEGRGIKGDPYKYNLHPMLKGLSREQIDFICKNTVAEYKGKPTKVLDMRELDRDALIKTQSAIIEIVQNIISDENRSLKLAVPPGKTLWHVFVNELIPEEQQKMGLVTAINQVFKRLGGPERLRILHKKEGLNDVLAGLMKDPNNIVHVVVNSEQKISEVPEGVKMAVVKGELGNYTQLEGIMAISRALSIEDVQERNSRLCRLYKMLTGKDFIGSFPAIDDPRALALAIVFNLPKIIVMDSKELQNLNKNLIFLIQSA